MGRWRRFERRRPGRRSTHPDLARRIAAADQAFAAERLDEALPLLAGVAGELERLHDADPGDTDLVVLLASVSYKLGVGNNTLGRYDAALPVLEQAVELFTALPGRRPEEEAVTWAVQLAGATQALASAHRGREDWPEALDHSRTALDLWHRLPPEAKGDHVAVSLRQYALVRVRAGVELDEALDQVEESMAIHMALLSDDPEKPYVEEIYLTELVQAAILRAMDRDDAADRVEALSRDRHLDGFRAALLADRRA